VEMRSRDENDREKSIEFPPFFPSFLSLNAK